MSSVNPMAVLMRIAIAVLRSTEGMGCRREGRDVPKVTALRQAQCARLATVCPKIHSFSLGKRQTEESIALRPYYTDVHWRESYQKRRRWMD